MNKYTLRFDNSVMEELYFQDQFDELFSFYTWACVLGSISAFFVFILEFFVPFGFGLWMYTLVMIPISFVISHRIIKQKPQYFNLILAMMNLPLGTLIYILLFYFSKSNFLFLAGQTVAMIQYSLLLGSNIILNISILLLNQLGLMIMGTLIQNYFNSLQTMFMLSIILVMKSIWSNEKMKRQFFLLKHQNIQLHRHLDNVFRLKIIRCKLDKKSIKLKLLNKNSQAEKIIQDQTSFTQFIRENIQVLIKSQSLQGQLNSSKKVTLEQLLFRIIEGEEKEKIFQIFSNSSKVPYKTSVYKVFDSGEVNLIILLQEDADYSKMMKLNQELIKKSIIQKQLYNCLENTKQSLKVIRYIEYNQQNDQNNKKETKQSFNNKVQSNFKLLELSHRSIFKAIYEYYNCLLYNDEFGSFNQVIKFNQFQFQRDLNKTKYILETKNKINLIFNTEEFQCQSQYSLILQLFLNFLSDQQTYQNFELVEISMKNNKVAQIGVIEVKILIHHSFQQQIPLKTFFNLKQINQKILGLIGLNKDFKITRDNCYDKIEFDLLESLIEFQKGIQK